MEVPQCNVELKLNEIVTHEEKCKHRLVKCPDPGCQEMVQLCSYKDHHAEEHIVGRTTNGMKNKRLKYILSKGYFHWDGTSVVNFDEMDLSRDKGFTFARLNFLDKTFYCLAFYQKDKRYFSFCMFLAEDPPVATDFKVKMSILNKDSSRKITYNGDVLPIEKVPSPKGNFLDLCRKCWCVSYETIRHFFWIENVEEFTFFRGKISDENVTKVPLHMEIEVYEKKVKPNPFSIL